jgi:hypothetical protein
LLISISALVPREQTKTRERPQPSSLAQEFADFLRAGGGVFGLCIVILMLLKMGQLLFEHGVELNANAPATVLKLIIPMIHSFIPITVCLFTTWHLASRASGGARPGLSFVQTAIAIGVVVCCLAFFFDLAFLRDYLKGDNEKYAPGWEHVLFSVFANVVVSILAFASVSLFFRKRDTQLVIAPAPKDRNRSAPRRRPNRPH